MKKQSNRNRVLFLMLIIVFTLLSISVVSAQPTDISGHWAESQISNWFDKGLAEGYPDGTFKPDSTITRAEFAAMVNRAFNFTESGEVNVSNTAESGTTTGFSDVSLNKWYAKDIAIASQTGYILGYDDGTFKPDNMITRQEAAVMIGRILKLDTSDLTQADVFNDVSQIQDWGKGPIGAIADAGIMQGYPDGTFQPQRLITRAEALVSLDRAMNYDGVDIVQPVTPEAPKVTVNDKTNEVSGMTTAMEYKLDSGDWVKYRAKVFDALDFSGKHTLLVRYAADGDNPFGPATTLTFTRNTSYRHGRGSSPVNPGNNVLYYADVNQGTDYMDSALTACGFDVTKPADWSEFNTELQTGDFDLAISFNQGDIPNLDKDIMAAYIAQGGKVIFTDWNKTSEFAQLFNASYTGNENETPITITESALSNRITNPMSISNPGWGTWSMGLSATGGGQSLAYFPNSDDAIVLGNQGRTAILGFLGDTPPADDGQKFFENLLYFMTEATAPTHVSSITVTGEGSATTITTDNGTLQMSAAVLPDDANNKSVTWSVTNADGTETDKATINEIGLLTALKDGEVKVVATAKDGSGVQGELITTISGQETAPASDPVVVGDMHTAAPTADGYAISGQPTNIGKYTVGTRTGSSPAFATVIRGTEALVDVESANPAQGTAKWVGVLITTDEEVTDLAVKTPGMEAYTDFTQADVDEAVAAGGATATKTFVWWLKSEEIGTGKDISIKGQGEDESTAVTLSVTFEEYAAPAPAQAALDLLEATADAETTSYEAILLEVGALPESDYTAPSWTDYATAIADCDLTLTAADGQAALDAEVTAIQAALDLLENL